MIYLHLKVTILSLNSVIEECNHSHGYQVSIALLFKYAIKEEIL